MRDAAAALLAQKGLAQTSLERIAETAGSIAEYFDEPTQSNERWWLLTSELRGYTLRHPVEAP